MSKLKLYNQTDESRAELLTDLEQSVENLRQYQVVADLWDRRIEPHRMTNTIESVYMQMEFFNKFSQELKQALQTADADFRAKGDLLKYQLLSYIESQSIQAMEGIYGIDRCSNMQVDPKLKGIERSEAQFNAFMEYAHPGENVYIGAKQYAVADVSRIHEQVQKTFITLSKYFKTKELAEDLTKAQNNPQVTRYTIDKSFLPNSNLSLSEADKTGKTTWTEWFGDIGRNILSFIKKAEYALGFKKEELKESNLSEAPKIRTPVEIAVGPTLTKIAQANRKSQTPPPIPSTPAPAHHPDFPDMPPPPIPTGIPNYPAPPVPAVVEANTAITTKLDASLATKNANKPFVGRVTTKASEQSNVRGA